MNSEQKKGQGRFLPSLAVDSSRQTPYSFLGDSRTRRVPASALFNTTAPRVCLIRSISGLGYSHHDGIRISGLTLAARQFPWASFVRHWHFRLVRKTFWTSFICQVRICNYLDRSKSTTADRTRPKADGKRIPTERAIKVAFAVNSFPGRATLATSSPPVSKSEGSRGTALGSP